MDHQLPNFILSVNKRAITFIELKFYFLLYFIQNKLSPSHVNNADVMLRFSHSHPHIFLSIWFLIQGNENYRVSFKSNTRFCLIWGKQNTLSWFFLRFIIF